jgi:hypothetical protein
MYCQKMMMTVRERGWGIIKDWILFGSLIPSDVAHLHGFQIRVRELGDNKLLTPFWNQMLVRVRGSHTRYMCNQRAQLSSARSENEIHKR